MKQNYIFYLVGILSICNTVFSMEIPLEVKTFRTAYASALQFESEANAATSEEEKSKLMAQAFEQYGKAAEITLPESTGIFVDEYSTERKNQKKAIDKLESKADSLMSNYKVGEALKICQLAPSACGDKIEFLEEVKKQALETAQTDIFPKALDLADEDKYVEASALLESIISAPNELDVVKEAATDILNAIRKREAKASKTSEKTLISALHNLKNGFVQIGKKMAIK